MQGKTCERKKDEDLIGIPGLNPKRKSDRRRATESGQNVHNPVELERCRVYDEYRKQKEQSILSFAGVQLRKAADMADARKKIERDLRPEKTSILAERTRLYACSGTRITVRKTKQFCLPDEWLAGREMG